MKFSVWTDRWVTLRDRLFANPGFRRWALAFPLTRPIARRRTRTLFDICAGFVYSQILFACVELRLFDLLAEGPRSAPDIARRLSLTPDAAARLLAAASALRLVTERAGDRFALGPLGAAMVGNEAVAAMIRHHGILYGDLSDPVALLRGTPVETGLSRYWAYARSAQPDRLSPDKTDGYTSLMATSQAMIADEILAAYPLSRHRHLLDIGGGDGSFLAAAAGRAHDLILTLFDLPAVADQARSRFAALGEARRMTAIGGDFLTGALPRGADLISLIRVLHDHNDEAALKLLIGIRHALGRDGRLLIAEPMSGTPGAEPAGAAYFGFYLLAMRCGRPRTADEIKILLRKAGFSRSREIRTRNPILVRLILAQP